MKKLSCEKLNRNEIFCSEKKGKMNEKNKHAFGNTVHNLLLALVFLAKNLAYTKVRNY